ncbi:MAG: 3-(cis-5,6-dihydroxycyclohexa-1,3-dien-1-yl)propanoate dehydrogenase [Acidimicrobiia bacterium]
MAGWLEGRAALVTGGGSGIGRAVVDRFVREGARVGVLEIAPDRADALTDAHGDAVVPVTGDVTQLEDNARAVKETVGAFGALDVFVGNSGIMDGFTPLAALSDDNIEDVFDSLFAVNVKGYLLGAKATLPELLKTRGSMIFTVSNAGFYAGGGGPVYTATKHAVVGLICQLAHELAPKVRVNGVAPGGTVTDLRLPPALGTDPDGNTRRAFDVPDIEDAIRGVTPLHMAPSPADHAAAYVLLASPENSPAMTGAIINSDGGLGVRGLKGVSGGDDL